MYEHRSRCSDRTRALRFTVPAATEHAKSYSYIMHVQSHRGPAVIRSVMMIIILRGFRFVFFTSNKPPSIARE